MALLPAIVAILFTDLFDSLSTFIGVASAAGLTDADGRPINLRRGLIVDAVATLASGLAGTSPGTAYVESIAGIRMGGRSGRASVVTALCFVPCFFLAPLASPSNTRRRQCSCCRRRMFQSIARLFLGSKTRFTPSSHGADPAALSITRASLGFLMTRALNVAGRWRDVGLTLWCLSLLFGGPSSTRH